jgi:hypothetical protein
MVAVILLLQVIQRVFCQVVLAVANRISVARASSWIFIYCLNIMYNISLLNLILLFPTHRLKKIEKKGER